MPVPASLSARLPRSVRVVEVAPRDGLQNTPSVLPAATKIELIERLSDAGLGVVEATSFVSPAAVPQLADAGEVLRGIRRRPGVVYPVLVPNLKGLERALEAGADEVAIFASATETFSQRNLGRGRREASEAFRAVVERATGQGLRVRGYLSMVLGDPWEGEVPAAQVVEEAVRLLDLGCYEISLGDTIGVGTPASVEGLIGSLVGAGVEASRLAVHFHDTYGQGLANVLVALEHGVQVVDASAGGLGGCPFARSATGNLATEDLVFMLDGLGVRTGVDVVSVAEASAWICGRLQLPVPGRAARALAPPADPD